MKVFMKAIKLMQALLQQHRVQDSSPSLLAPVSLNFYMFHAIRIFVQNLCSNLMNVCSILMYTTDALSTDTSEVTHRQRISDKGGHDLLGKGQSATGPLGTPAYQLSIRFKSEVIVDEHQWWMWLEMVHGKGLINGCLNLNNEENESNILRAVEVAPVTALRSVFHRVRQAAERSRRHDNDVRVIAERSVSLGENYVQELFKY
ncbi:hypothetical protein SSX86_007199 [Deinandra increscens subsp. villosa]|uniref:Uncharacterized protein n=1 Tax=Deinandra increscens subsp. villosa TaxID=3103831 RepID=A0AAP0DHG4_9ASTR